MRIDTGPDLVLCSGGMPKNGDPVTRTWAPSLEAIRHLLAGGDILKSVPSLVVDQLARMALPKGLAQGDRLWGEGEPLYFAIVCRGQLEVSKEGGLLDIMLPNQALGHSALLGKRHTATVVAAVDSHVLRFDAVSFFGLAQQSPPFMVAVLADVLALVSKLNGDVSSLRGPLRQGLLHRLRWLSRGKKQTQIDVTHKQLAKLTGSTKWSVNRELKEMEESGAIRRGFKSIEIIDLDLDENP